MAVYSIERDELATILAALRFYQGAGMGEPDNRSDAIHAIATDGDVISLDAAAIDTLCESLNRGGLSGAETRTIFGNLQLAEQPHLNAYRQAVETSDELEVDENAIVSDSDDGAFVMAWVWVTNEEAGIVAPEYSIDGKAVAGDPESDDIWHGDGAFAPFRIFDATAQEHLPESYDTLGEAEAAMAALTADGDE